ncbi:MAG: tetratricopeptide repeat protein [Bdellovibrio sp.]|nr:MAG: tetratricopeptide repeat protein [Bdellovibrio sp.]
MKKIVLLFYFVSCFLGKVAWAASPIVVHKNNKAASLLKKSLKKRQEEKFKKNQSEIGPVVNTFEAYQNLIDALRRAPQSPELHLNLGFYFELEKEPDKALQEYEYVIKLNPKKKVLLFAAYFNAGNIEAQKKNIERALYFYQKALDIFPQSKEVKTNIELLWLKQQGGGQGGGQSDDNQQDKGNKGQGSDYKQQKERPQDFKSQRLPKNEVRKILEELKRQEEKIRAKENRQKKGKEEEHDKNW